MATDYFAHCVFGIVLEGKEHEAFQAQYDLARAKLIEAYVTAQEFEGDDVEEDDAEQEWLDSLADIDLDEFETVVEAIPDDALAGIRQSVGAPDDASFHSSDDGGGEDERPGRSATECGVVIVGYGPFDVLQLVAERFSPDFRRRVNYENWVTSG